MRKALRLDDTPAEQRRLWRYYVDQTGDDIVKWRNLAHQAKQAVRFGGDKQAWRYTLLAASAPNEEIVNGIYNMATLDGVYNPDLEEAISARIEELANRPMTVEEAVELNVFPVEDREVLTPAEVYDLESQERFAGMSTEDLVAELAKITKQ